MVAYNKNSWIVYNYANKSNAYFLSFNTDLHLEHKLMAALLTVENHEVTSPSSEVVHSVLSWSF